MFKRTTVHNDATLRRHGDPGSFITLCTEPKTAGTTLKVDILKRSHSVGGSEQHVDLKTLEKVRKSINESFLRRGVEFGFGFGFGFGFPYNTDMK